MSASTAQIERDRLYALRSYAILDSGPERAFDELTQLAAQICQTPIASVTLLDEKRQWFKSIVGLSVCETPRAIAFCDHAIRGTEIMVVPDARLDPRFAANPLVTGDPRIRFYAGVPLIGVDGFVLGTLAVLDRQPRELDASQLAALRLLANQAMDQLEMRLHRLQLERTLAEKERLQQEQVINAARLCDAQRMAGVGSWRSDLGNNGLTWTDEVFRIVGIPPQSLQPTYETFLNLVHPDDRKSLILAREDTAGRGEPLDIEHRIIRPDGSIRHVHERGELVYNAEGQAEAVVGTVTDITERKTAHLAMRDSERRYREIVQTSPDLIFVQQGGRITFINDAGLCLLHATFMEQVLGLPFLDFVHPDFRQATQARLEWLLEVPRAGPVVEKKIIAVDGTVLDVEMRAVSFPSSEGMAVQVVCRDITERNRAQAELLLSERRLRQVLDSLPMAAYTCDAEGLLTYFNEKALELWGRTPRVDSRAERFSGAFRLFRPDGAAVMPEDSWMANTLRELRAFTGVDTVVERPDGSRRHVTVHTNPLFDAEGKLAGAVNVLMDVTAHRQAQEALRESEERFRIVAKATTDAIWDWDLQADTIWWNDGMQSLFGFAPEEIEPGSNSWTGRIHPDDQLRVLTGLFGFVEGDGQHWEEEYHFQRKDGTYAYVLDRGFVIRNSAGRPIRMIGGMTDLSERRGMENDLKQSEANFRELAENIDEVFYNRDLVNNRLLYISPAYETIWGQTRESAYANASSYLDAVHPRDAGAVRAAHARHDHGEETDIEYRIVTRGGVVRWIRDHSYPIFNAQGRVERVVGTARDITERKRADQRILEQAQLLDKAHDAIVVRDLEHHVIYWNKSAERLYGWSAEETLGRPVENLLYRDPAEFTQAFKVLLDNGEWSGEFQQISKGGTGITVEARWTLVRDDNGQPKAVLAIHTDITEQKRMEAQFLRAQRMESIGTLAGGIAHDLNNVLAPIMMSIDLLKLSTRDRNDLAILSTIELSARRGAEMVQQVLAFARGVEGRRLVIDPVEVVRDVQHLVHETFPKNIDFHAHLPVELPPIIGDPTQVHQVLINLCVNARDAMPEGGRLDLSATTVRVDEQYATLNPNAKPGPYVMLTVADDGSGMPKEIQDKIFDPFFTTKELSKGTGLGLSTVLAIVKSHGGFINVDSQPGSGTTFAVHFPAHARSHDKLNPLMQEIHPRGRGEVVLVVDDEESVRAITRRTLEAFGYSVMTACDGAEAVALYAQHRGKIEVVLTDMMMPVMDGPAAIQVLTRMNPEVRIIAASGLNLNGSVAKAADLGVKHFLPKPYTAQTLLLALQDLMGLSGQSAALSYADK